MLRTLTFALAAGSALAVTSLSLGAQEAGEGVTEYAPGSTGRITAPLATIVDTAKQQGEALRQTGGFLFVRSEPGRGTAFRILLPRHTEVETAGLEIDLAPETPAVRRSDIGETGGRVPITEFRNRMNTTGECRSEIDDVIDIQDRINTTLFHRLLASQFAAHKQKWATGLEIPDDPTTGEPVEPFKEAVDRLWVAEDPDVTFGQFEGTDLSPYISSVESDIQHLAAITRTPPHYLLGQSGAFPSGESLKSTETGLVAKSRRRQRFTDPSWTRVIELQTGRRVEIVWADPESRTEGELVDSLTKMATLGVPLKALWERYGASPEQQDDWERQLRTQALNAQGLDLAALGAEPQA